MAFTECDVATNNIASLDDLPNDVGGLTATQLKAMFDKFGTDFVAWFNATHIVEADAHLEENAAHAELTNKTITVGTGKDYTVLQTAIGSLKKRIDANITINVDAGTYAEDIMIYGFVGDGSLTINGDTAVSTNYTVNWFNILNCTIPITIRGFNTTATTVNSFDAKQCISVTLNHCNSVQSSAAAGVSATDCTMVKVANSTLSNRTHGVLSIRSRVASDTNGGTGNTYGLTCEAGVINKNSTQPAGTTAELITKGGEIR